MPLTKAERERLIAAGRPDLVEIDEINASGYAGVLPNGNIVDRRKHPAAVAVQRNSIFNIPSPKKLLPVHIFAKIFQVTVPGSDELHQVLVQRKRDEEGQPVITLSCQLSNVAPTVLLGYDDDTVRDAYFEKYGEAEAQEFITNVLPYNE